jgi:hypothetical protein
VTFWDYFDRHPYVVTILVFGLVAMLNHQAECILKAAIKMGFEEYRKLRFPPKQ